MERFALAVIAVIGLVFVIVAIPVTFVVLFRWFHTLLHPLKVVKYEPAPPEELPASISRVDREVPAPPLVDEREIYRGISARLGLGLPVESVSHNYSGGTWTTTSTYADTPHADLTPEQREELLRTEFNDLIASVRLDPDYSVFANWPGIRAGRAPVLSSTPQERRTLFESVVRTMDRGALAPPTPKTPEPPKEPVAPVRTTWQRLKDED